MIYLGHVNTTANAKLGRNYFHTMIRLSYSAYYIISSLILNNVLKYICCAQLDLKIDLSYIPYLLCDKLFAGK